MKRIIYTNEFGGVSIITPTGELSIEEVAAKDVPAGVNYKIIEENAIPTDRTFRDAWMINGDIVEVDLSNAKKIAHNIRRSLRNEEFSPLDDMIAKQIPGTDVDAVEEKRKIIRQKYAVMQDKIDLSDSASAIKEVLGI